MPTKFCRLLSDCETSQFLKAGEPLVQVADVRLVKAQLLTL